MNLAVSCCAKALPFYRCIAVLQGSSANDIFDEIWKNNPLRTKLFGAVANTPQAKATAKNDFNDLVNTLDNKVFVFVDVHY